MAVATRALAILEVLKVIAIPAQDLTETVAMKDLALLPLPTGGVLAAVPVAAAVELWAAVDGATEDPRPQCHLAADRTVPVVDLSRLPFVEDGVLHQPRGLIKV